MGKLNAYQKYIAINGNSPDVEVKNVQHTIKISNSKTKKSKKDNQYLDVDSNSQIQSQNQNTVETDVNDPEMLISNSIFG